MINQYQINDKQKKMIVTVLLGDIVFEIRIKMKKDEMFIY